MTTTLAPLLENTYVRTDMAYRLSLLGEFLNFAFFTDGAATVTKETFEHFAKQQRDPQKDVAFLETLPTSFWDMFTPDSFRQILDRLETELALVPVLLLTIPVDIPAKQMAPIGQWARAVVGDNTLLDISIDPTLATGCQFIWKNKLHDFSFAHYIAEHQPELIKRISTLLTAQSA